MTNKRKKQKLKGFLQSGILFIGDPVSMSGPSNYQSDGKGGQIDITPEDPHNPFRRWDSFTSSLNNMDVNMVYPEAQDPQATGRGIVIQTNMLSGQYEVKKKICKTTGKLLELKVIFRD